ncbi:hypothetical protein AB6806_23905 [Bosea sp. RCC_152_1]|uniref:hypothetical protein n=1 Tax=Bosea sp. RCC_152_1 TaxID=3239228 RepID=UPI003526238D
MAKASNEVFEQLHEALAKDLLKRVQDGSATAADLNVARAFLKDNCISSLPAKDSPLAGLLAKLPFSADDADEDATYN